MGRGACWCVTFFSLCGVLVVKAIQNSPCWRKMRRKWVFRACWESFVPVGLAEAASRESFVPTPAPRAVQSSPCSTCWWWERYKVLPAGVKRAEMGHFGGAGRVLYRCRPLGCELGEFCTGSTREGCEQGEFCTGPSNQVRRAGFAKPPEPLRITSLLPTGIGRRDVTSPTGL